MDKRIDAKRAMGAHQARAAPLEEVEAGPPHQRPIAKDPEVLVALIGSCVHRGRGMDHGVGGPACVRVTGRQFPRNPALHAGAETPHSAGF